MTKIIEINEPKDIYHLLDYIHDRSYQFSDLEYSCEDSCVKILTNVVDDSPVLVTKGILRNKWRLNVYRAVLSVREVLDYSIHDKAEIGKSDINTIEYENGEIEIKGSMPVTLRIRVSSLCMKLEISDEPFRTEERTSYRFLRFESST